YLSTKPAPTWVAPCRTPRRLTRGLRCLVAGGTTALPRPIAQREVDPPLVGRMRIAPPLDEAWRIRIVLGVLSEFHEGAGHGLIQMRQLQTEFVRLMLDHARVAGCDRRQQESHDGADQQKPRQRGGIAPVGDSPTRSPSRQTALENLLADEEHERRQA